ncbi:MAG: cytochrome c, partial [Candidatus Neomarinimicrobiota bacterium]
MRVKAPDVTVEITPERVALGKKLAEGIMACGSCHTTGSATGDPQLEMYLAGDVCWPDQWWGTVTAPNITPNKETGIGDWTDGEIIRAITKGVGSDGRVLNPGMPWPEFGTTLTQEEIYALVAYLPAAVGSRRTSSPPWTPRRVTASGPPSRS